MKHGILATIGALLISASTINAADKSGALIIVSDLPESNDLHTALVEKIGHNNSDKVIYVKPAEASTAALPENVEGIVSIGIGTIRSSIDLAERSNPDYLVSIGDLAMSKKDYGKWLLRQIYLLPGKDLVSNTAERRKINASPDSLIAKYEFNELLDKFYGSPDNQSNVTALSRLSMPVFIINGMNDPLIPWYQNVECFDNAISSNPANCVVACPEVNGLLFEFDKLIPPFAAVDFAPGYKPTLNENAIETISEWIEKLNN